MKTKTKILNPVGESNLRGTPSGPRPPKDVSRLRTSDPSSDGSPKTEEVKD